MSDSKTPAPGESEDAGAGEHDVAKGEGEDASVNEAGSAAKGGEAPVEAGVSLFGRHVSWINLERGASLAGFGSLVIFIWAGFNQLNQWQAAPFVLLFYGSLLGAAVASYAARRGALPGGEAALPRRVLWGFVIVFMLWFWVPPSRYAFFWLYRQVAVYFLS